MIACIAKFERMKIKDFVEKTTYFSTIADEVTEGNDGAAAMSSQTNSHFADWVHCRNHCINLAIAFTYKTTSFTSFYYYFANSPKRQECFERFIDYYKDETSVAANSQGLSKTRLEILHCSGKILVTRLKEW